jgi:hypothetical protein
MIKINKEIHSKIYQDYIFIVGSLKFNYKYFISKIEGGIKENSSLNFRTNVEGYMTSWNYFNEDFQFRIILCEIFDKLDSIKFIKSYNFCECWGLKEGIGNRTKLHAHLPNYISGVIYLNDHSQKLYFPEINEEITPEEGKIVIFSSFLNHKTDRNIFNKPKYALSFNLNHTLV